MKQGAWAGPEPDHPSDRLRVVGLACAGHALVAACFSSARSFLPALRGDLVLDAVPIGAMVGISCAAHCLATVVAMMLTARCGARHIAMAAGFAATAGNLIAAGASSGEAFLVGVFVAGLSTGLALPPLVHAVTHGIPARVRNRTLHVIASGIGVGFVIGGLASLSTRGESRHAWLSLAVVSALATMWVALGVPARSQPRHAPAPRLCRHMPRHQFLQPGLGRLVTGASLFGVASSGVVTFGADLLAGPVGLSPSAVMIAWFALGCGGALSAGAGGPIRRVGPHRSWTIAAVVLTMTTLLLPAAQWPAGLAWSFVAIFGFACVVLAAMLLIWGTGLYPGVPVIGAGLASFAIAVGHAAGTLFLGTLWEIAGAGSVTMAAVGAGFIAANVRFGDEVSA